MTRQNQSKLVKTLGRASSQIFLALSLIALAAITLPKDKIIQARLKDGRIATYIKSPWTIKNSLCIGNSFYFKKGKTLEYTSPNGRTYRITPEGYSTFNPETGNYESFVRFSQDSTLYWRMKDYEDIMNQINAEQERQASIGEQ